MLLLQRSTALSEMMRSTPSVFTAQMLARKFNSDGERRLAAPVPRQECDGLPASVPERHIFPKGSPRCVDGDFLMRLKSRHRIPPAAPDDPIVALITSAFNSRLRVLNQSSNTPPVEPGWTKDILMPPALASAR